MRQMKEYFLSHPTPVIASLELTLRCNHQCVHCYLEKNIPSEREELTRGEVRSVFEGLARLGSLILVFTGGEIFLRKDLLDILKDSRKLGFAPVLFTNGTLIRPEHLDALYEIAPLGIEISLHSAQPEVHDAITRSPGSHAAALGAIRNLKARGLRVKIKGNLMQSNKGDYEGLISLAGNLGCEYTLDPFIFPCRDHDASPVFERLGADSLRGVFSDGRLIKGKKEGPGKEYLEDPQNRLCGAGANVISISSNGDVFPCIPLKLKAGNVREQNIESLWRESSVLEKLRQYRVKDLAACRECPSKKHCLRCSAMTYNETGDLLGCSPLSSRVSEVRREIYREKVLGRDKREPVHA
jgi:radical SAM protein with 4Fe4S-binding SPASM domain